jgi:hypothetical protein
MAQYWPGWQYRFYFGVDRDFPQALLAGEGLIVADRFAREAPLRPLGAARRKAMLLRFARLAAARLHALLDPVVGESSGPRL